MQGEPLPNMCCDLVVDFNRVGIINRIGFVLPLLRSTVVTLQSSHEIDRCRVHVDISIKPIRHVRTKRPSLVIACGGRALRPRWTGVHACVLRVRAWLKAAGAVGRDKVNVFTKRF